MRKHELHPRTEVINKKQKNQAKIARNKALNWLSTTFPQVFDNSVLIQPLKLGIMNDVLAHADKALAAGISKSKLREAVVIFTRRIDYLTCLKAREMRVDLEGKAVSPVSEDEANHAAIKIKKRVEKSTKNARKILPNPSSTVNHSRINVPIKYPTEPYASPYHSEQLATSNPQNNAQSARTGSVLIKHKSTRAYDPEAVARMKEKLGLSRKQELNEEVT